jgi:hypothetical protein
LAFLPASQVDGLLLSYLASRNRGLFAARCFVETVLEAYGEGARVEDLAVRRVVFLRVACLRYRVCVSQRTQGAEIEEGVAGCESPLRRRSPGRHH